MTLPVRLPPILLEDDLDTPPSLTGPGCRYALPPLASAEPLFEAGAELDLEEDYGVGRLWLSVRDPRSLHAFWDLAPAQAAAALGELRLRVYAGREIGPHFHEIPVAVTARSAFVNLETRESQYVAELGFSDAAGTWHPLARSTAVGPPPFPAVVEAEEVRFVTVVHAPAEAPRKVELAPDAVTAVIEAPVSEIEIPPSPPAPAPETSEVPSRPVSPPLPVLPAPAGAGDASPEPASLPVLVSRPERPSTRRKEAPGPVFVTMPTPDWPEVRAGAMEALIVQLQPEVVAPSSVELAAGVDARRLRAGVSAFPTSPTRGFGRLEAGSDSAVPISADSAQRKFWFNVHSELVVYGATEPDARVTVEGMPVELRHDGSFTLRFALPDGDYALTAEAESADAQDRRLARLHFARRTDYSGAVGLQPGDPALTEPPAAKGGR